MKQKELSSPLWPEGVPSAAKELAIDRPANPTAGRLRGVLKVVLGLGLLAFTNSALSANWYVRPTSAGANNGADWNNAWSMSSLNANWGSVQPGDTVWLAGGTYTTSINPKKSGTAGNLIYVKRVLSSDSVPVSAAGWNSSFDSQVVITSGSTPLYWNTLSAGSYMYFDGRVDSGIQLNVPNSGASYPGAIYFADGSGGQRDITFTNLDCAGPGGNTTFSTAVSVVSCRTWNGSAFVGVSNITIAACRIHGGPNLVLLCNASYWTFDRCKFYDNNAANSSAFHPNLVEYLSSGNITFKNCDITGWSTEGIMPYGTSTGPLFVYGCVWHDPSGGPYPRIIELFTPTVVYFYNNTIANVNYGIFSWTDAANWNGSQVKNNILWNSAGFAGNSGITYEYNFSSATVSGANSISSGSNPFVSYAGKDYQIVSNISAVLPRNKGVALGAPYNLGAYGNLRGADGAWDIGAYESGGATSTNTAPTVSSINQNAADVDPNVPGLQVLEGTVVQYSGTASDPDHYPSSQLNWQWLYTVNGGGEVVFQSGTGTVNPATFIYGAGTGGNTYNWKLRVTDGEAWAESQLTVGVKPAPVAGGGLAFEAESVAVTAPFITNNSSAPIYIYQSTSAEANLQAGGRAAYTFTITNAGHYVIQAVVNAPSDAQNSFFVNIDSEAQDLTNSVWQIPVTTGFESRIVNWQGNGTWNNPQLVPKIFNLTNGTHQIIFRGREANTQLDRFAILKLPVAPQGVRIQPP